MDKMGLALFLLLGSSIFVSKAMVNLVFCLLIFLSVLCTAKVHYRKRVLKNSYLLILLFPIAVGFFLSFFSLSGPRGAMDFLIRYRFFFLVIPFVLFVSDKKTVVFLIAAMNVGALVDMVYVLFHTDLAHSFRAVNGLHKFGRHSDMMFSLGLVNISCLLAAFRAKTFFGRYWKMYLILLIQTAAILLTVIFIGQRAAYIGLLCGIMALAMIYSKKILAGLLIVLILSSFFIPDFLRDRTRSIVDPNQVSNLERMGLLALGYDFFIEKKLYVRGAGAEGVSSALQKFIAKKSGTGQNNYEDLLKRYPDNFHNSYLQMAIEGGLVFVLLYLAGLCYLVIKMIRSPLFADGFLLTSAVALFFGFGLSQFFHEEFFRYGGLVFFIMFYSGCMALQRQQQS